MLDWIQQHENLMIGLGIFSIASLVLVAILLPFIVVRLPADHFVRVHHVGHGPRGWLDWIWHLGKNLLGLIFLLAGIAMLVLPGQGLLTMLIGLLMMDFPGKRHIERKLLARPAILKVVNRMREKRGVPPLITKSPAAAQSQHAESIGDG